MARIIAKLDIKTPHVVKPLMFEGLKKVGDPVEIAKDYYYQGIDELYYEDIVSSLHQTPFSLPWIRDVATELFIPFSVGGGIRSIDDISTILHSGADKVSINSYALVNPDLISQAAKLFGSQAVSVNIQAKSIGNQWVCYSDGGKIQRNKNVIAWAQEVEQRGAGEIFLQSIDRDGLMQGFDLSLAKSVVEAVNIPVVVASGAGNVSHVVKLIREVNPSGVAIASMLHDGSQVDEIKNSLLREGCKVVI